MTTTMTSKGQVTIPKAIREQLGLKPGDRVEFQSTEHGISVRRASQRSVFDRWIGALAHLRGRDTDELLDEMRGSERRRRR